MAGVEVSRQGLDNKIGQALLGLRSSLAQCESINIWLSNNPVPNADPNEDPLVVDLGYTVDEAYVIRLVFEQIATVKASTTALEANARKLTGLE